MAAEIRTTFPILSCMVSLLEASSIVGANAGPTNAEQSMRPTSDSLLSARHHNVMLSPTGAPYKGRNTLLCLLHYESNAASNVDNSPILKGMDVAYGRRHGGASKYANMLGTAIQKYSVLLKR